MLWPIMSWSHRQEQLLWKCSECGWEHSSSPLPPKKTTTKEQEKRSSFWWFIPRVFMSVPSSYSAFPAVSLGFTIFWWDFCIIMWPYYFNTILSSWMVHAGCAPGIYSHPQEFLGIGVRTHVHSQGKNYIYWTAPSRAKPVMLHHLG